MQLITVKEHPQLMTTMMVQSLLSNLKTQTRRVPTSSNSLVDGVAVSAKWFAKLDFSKAVLENGPSPAGNAGPYLKVPHADGTRHRVYCKYQDGDQLWIRETWAADDRDGRINYKADWKDIGVYWKWKPSIHMPREASRIQLEVLKVRVERLNDITESDAENEGVKLHERGEKWLNYLDQKAQLTQFIYNCRTAVRSYQTLWQLINGYGSWEANPWVWVIEFRRVKP